jgi:hypothetical protein
MPIRKAIADSFGLKDVMMDTLDTLRGSGFSYRSFEPSEGVPHMGSSRTSRIMAGLRYSNMTTKKRWLEPAPTSRFLNSGRGMNDESEADDDYEPLEFEDPNSADEMESLYKASRKMVFGDYNYPVIDFRVPLWRLARRERRQQRGYGGTSESTSVATKKSSKSITEGGLLGPREGCIDVIIEQGKGNYVLVDDLLSEDEEAHISTKPALQPTRKPTLSNVHRHPSASTSTPTPAQKTTKHLAPPPITTTPSFSTPNNKLRYPTSKPNLLSTSPQKTFVPTEPSFTLPQRTFVPVEPSFTSSSNKQSQEPSDDDDAPVWQWPADINRKPNHTTSFTEDDLLSSDVWK